LAGCGERPGVGVAGVATAARVANRKSNMSDIAGGITLDASDVFAVERSGLRGEGNIDEIIDALRK
jgi:hypothetical protein